MSNGGESAVPTAWAVRCFRGCGQVFLTVEEYGYQLSRPDRFWECPRCREEASWDDENYEEKQMGFTSEN